MYSFNEKLTYDELREAISYRYEKIAEINEAMMQVDRINEHITMAMCEYDLGEDDRGDMDIAAFHLLAMFIVTYKESQNKLSDTIKSQLDYLTGMYADMLTGKKKTWLGKKHVVVKDDNSADK